MPHSDVIPLENNLWIVDGRVPHMGLHRRMSIIRLSDGRLVLHSVIAGKEELLKKIETLGEPAFMVVPNPYHRLDACFYQRRFPKLIVVCPKETTKQAKKVISVDGDFNLLPNDANLQIISIEGIRTGESGFLVNSNGQQSLIVTDLIFNVKHCGGLGGFIMRLIGSSGGPKVTPLFKTFLVKNKLALKQSLMMIAQVPNLKRMVMAHGRIIDTNVMETLEQIALAL